MTGEAREEAPVPGRIRVGRRVLRGWYEARRDAYPWRARPDPYRVLVSEVMLQQTQAARVAPAFGRFVAQFPSLRALADASPGDVLRAWGALGYNRRALNLLRSARAIVHDHGGVVPSDPAVLATLPGVGPYTAAAVASLGFGTPVAAVDVNVRRVVSRVLLDDDADEVTVRAAANAWLDPDDPAGWNQALMDLGREVCRPVPRCAECPIARSCRFRTGASSGGSSVGRTIRRQGRFEGSTRQVRGAVIRVLRSNSPSTIDAIARQSGHPLDRVSRAASTLHAEEMVIASPAALRGSPRGSVRLPEWRRGH
jgi:A/G-specific adenine glycosylase